MSREITQLTSKTLFEDFTERVYEEIVNEEFGITRTQLADRLGVYFNDSRLSMALETLTRTWRVKRAGYRYGKFEKEFEKEINWSTTPFVTRACREEYHGRCPSVRCHCQCHKLEETKA